MAELSLIVDLEEGGQKDWARGVRTIRLVGRHFEPVEEEPSWVEEEEGRQSSKDARERQLLHELEA